MSRWLWCGLGNPSEVLLASCEVENAWKAPIAVVAHRTSMLRDLELGLPVKTDVLVSTVQELATFAGVSAPIVDLIRRSSISASRSLELDGIALLDHNARPRRGARAAEWA